MADSTKRKVTQEELRREEFSDLLHDEKTGELYDISAEYYNNALQQRAPSVDREIELQLAKELLASNLNRLTAKQRDVLYLTMIRVTQSEIAKRMGLSVGTVQQHLRAAKKKLARIITGTKEILKEGLQNGSENID